MVQGHKIIIDRAAWKGLKVGNIIDELKESLPCKGDPQPWRSVFKKNKFSSRLEVVFRDDEKDKCEAVFKVWDDIVDGEKKKYKMTMKYAPEKRQRRGEEDCINPDIKRAKTEEYPSLSSLIKLKKKNIVYGDKSERQQPSLEDRTCPLKKYDYPVQMIMKEAYSKTIAKSMTKEVFEECRKTWKECPDRSFPSWAFSRYHRGIATEPVVPCPENFVSEYRNKMEFTIGNDFNWETKAFDSSKPLVGFVRASHHYEPVVEQENGLIHIPRISSIIAKKLQDGLVGNEELRPLKRCDLMRLTPEEQENVGSSRLLQVRTFPKDEDHPTSSGGEVMVTMLIFGDINTEHGKKIFDLGKTLLLSLFGNETDVSEGWKITSLYLAMNTQANDVLNSSDHHECVFGEKVLFQQLMGMKFYVDPFSFFQTNIGSTRLLYSKAIEWAVGDVVKPAAAAESSTEKRPKVLLLDVCCGTGTIGLIASEKLKELGYDSKLIGIDCVKEAINSAKRNTQLNGLDDNDSECEWIVDYVENAMSDILAREGDKIENEYTDIVCIVDPPRGGLHKKVLKALRDTVAIKRVVYISCNPESLTKDGAILSSGKSMMLGPELNCPALPLYPKRIIPLDMFPHTYHTEMIVEFVRTKEDDFVPLAENGWPAEIVESK